MFFFHRPHFVTYLELLSSSNLALDAPSAHLCDSVPRWDRLPCAPSSITEGDCKELGCCHDLEMNSCYYGNTGELVHL